MSDEGPAEWISVTEDGKPLPIQQLLTGRGFVSGKSGSGKSNTVSAICEELLEANYPLLIVDTEGEYFGLKEQYQLLHVGGDDFAEVQVGPEHAEKIAGIALEKNVPVILDVSGYDDTDTSEELITRVVDEIYTREKRVRKPFLLVVEEMQEYLPQQGGSGDLGELLERVAKRGRKRGLGMCGVSQRPSSVDKDYITQCDWMVWHKFTWESDLKVVSNVIGKERADECEEFGPGEAYLMTDWDDAVERVQFRQKRTFDAGATPDLESFDRPDLKQVGNQFVSEIRGNDSPAESNPDPYSEDEISEEGAAAEPAVADTEPLLDDDDADGKAAEPVSPGESVQATPEEFGEDELATLDDDEIVERAKRVDKENRILKDEIAELRDISETAESGEPSPFTERPPAGVQSSRSPSRRYGSSADAATGSGGGSSDLTPPARPQAPARQDVENAAARALFEFGDLMRYLWKLFVFYMRYAVYKLRVWAAGVGEQSGPEGQRRGRPD